MFSFTTEAGASQISGFIKSCQSHTQERPDDITLKQMRTIGAEELKKKGVRVPASALEIVAHSIPLAPSFESSAEQISIKRMATSCSPSYDLNNITSYNHYSCTYQGTGLDETGRRVKGSTYQKWKGILPSCDHSIPISGELEADIRKLVWHRAGGKEADLDVNQFNCRISSIPQL